MGPGSFVREVTKELGIDAHIVNARFIKPIDHTYLDI